MGLLDLDPAIVRSGWGPLLIVAVLLVACVLLFMSMRKHMNRIDVPYRDDMSDAANPLLDSRNQQG